MGVSVSVRVSIRYVHCVATSDDCCRHCMCGYLGMQSIYCLFLILFSDVVLEEGLGKCVGEGSGKRALPCSQNKIISDCQTSSHLYMQSNCQTWRHSVSVNIRKLTNHDENVKFNTICVKLDQKT